MKVSPPIELDTERLRLRQWRSSDLAPFAELNADPRVMERLGMLKDEVSRAMGEDGALESDR